MKNPSKKITIVIATLNGRNYLPECLSSIAQQHYPQNLIKVVVIDNGSFDSTVGYLRENYPEVKLITNHHNAGFARANNQGYFLARKAKSDYLFLLNQDAVLEKNCLRRLVELAESGKDIAAVQPKILLDPEKQLINSFGNNIQYLGFGFCNFYRHRDNLELTAPMELAYASGAALLLKMPALAKTGLFDENLFAYHEDLDLGWRLRLAGYSVWLDPLAVAWHKYTFSKAKYKFYYLERNRWKVILQNYKLATLILFLPPLLLMEISMFFYALLSGWLAEKIRGYGWLLLHIPTILWQRLAMQYRFRKVKDREILRLFTGMIKSEELQNPLLVYIANPLLAVYFWLVRKIIFW